MNLRDEPNMRPVNARPANVVDEVRAWLCYCGIPIPPGRPCCSRHAAQWGDEEATPVAMVRR